MKVIPIESIQEIEKTHPRSGLFKLRHLLQGEEGSPNNFSLELAKTFTDFYSPRHRHNFDQFRFQLEGEFDFSKNGKSPPGTVIYHPESVLYGPQTSSDAALTLVLQFAGAGGNGYISVAQLKKATEELRESGTFDKGRFIREDETGKELIRDAFEAVWEHVHQHPVSYSARRYQAPVFMYPENFDWMPVADEPGVEIKLLGMFTERRLDVGFVKLEPKSRHSISGPKVYFVTSGEGSLRSETYGKFTTIQMNPEEVSTIKASTHTEIYFMGLPDFPES